MSYFGQKNFLIEVAKGNVPKHSLVHVIGRNTAVANGSWELISNLSTSYTWLSAATTVRVKAGGNAADDASGDGARTIHVEGLDENLNYATEDITLAGASASSSTTTTFCRIFEAHVLTCGLYATPYNTGIIIIENTAGTIDLIEIDPTESQSEFCAYTIPTGYTAHLLSLAVQVDSTKPADIRLITRENIGDATPPVSAMRLRHFADGIEGEYEFIPNSPFLFIPAETDIFMEAEGDGAQTDVSADFELLLVQD